MMRIFNWENFQSDFCLRKSIILYTRVNIGVGYKKKLENITTTFFYVLNIGDEKKIRR